MVLLDALATVKPRITAYTATIEPETDIDRGLTELSTMEGNWPHRLRR